MNDHLLAVHIGPVQEFIAAARRCQDLWYGSHLLGTLATHAAETIQARRKVPATTIIFPGGLAAHAVTGGKASVSNKILAVLPDSSKEDVQNLMKEVQDAVFNFIANKSNVIFDEIQHLERGEEYRGLGLSFDRTTAEAQIRDLIEFQWAAVQQAAGGYAQARQEVEALLASVKRTKIWQQPTWGKAGCWKSSLDGVRESVLPDAQLDSLTDKNLLSEEKLYRLYRCAKRERLCGVSLLKRWGSSPNDSDPFHSLGHVASYPVRKRAESAIKIKSTQLRSAFEPIRARLEKYLGNMRTSENHPVFGHLDGSCLFPNRLQVEEQIPEGERKQLAMEMSQFLKGIGVSQPSPGCVILLADGDRMGAFIDAQNSQEKHLALSKQLHQFAENAAKIIRQHGGSLIYSGGDDVLALLPLPEALSAAKCLAEDFFAKLKSFATPGATTPTLSVGLALVHFLSDLGDSLNLARQAEQLAKKKRNSLALVLQKRGGEQRIATGQWDSDFLPMLQFWVEQIINGLMPGKLAHQWLQLARKFADSSIEKDCMELIQLEALRILDRKSGGIEALTPAKENDANARARAVEFLKGITPQRLAEQASAILIAKEIAFASRQSKYQEETA